MTKKIGSDYYFSTPAMVPDEPGRDDTEFTPTVIITSQAVWDRTGTIDDNVNGLDNVLKIGKEFAQLQEGFYQPYAHISCDELKTFLEKKGLHHNPSLDTRMREFVDDYMDV